MKISNWLQQFLPTALILGACAGPALGQTARITVQVDHPGHAISPVLYGLMTEEINYSYDGGLYAELVRNRAFKDDPENPLHWSLVEDGDGIGQIMLDKSHPLSSSLDTSLRLDITTPGKRVGAANDGYWGIPVKPHTSYQMSLYSRAAPGFNGALNVDLESTDGSVVYATSSIPAVDSSWKRYTATLTTGNVKPTKDVRLVISANRRGTIYLDLVSLFPPTYKHRANGNRVDLMRKLAALNPSFLRLPGGNYLEGDSIANRFDWKKTIGPLTDRPGHQGPWGYRSSDGMGLLEFMEWCEDLKMQPVLAVFAGYALNTEHVAPGPKLQPFVDDAMDEIEYVTGSPQTPWGARRVADGHPKPFPLTYVEISNEDGRFDYDGRFAQFFDAIKAKYPKLQIIATSNVTSRNPDLVDEHFYRSAAAMAADSKHYDSYSRKGPKIFVGEWASTEGSPTPTMTAALGDAAWMTGMERNSDLVAIEAYAPLLVNVNPGGSQWGTNLVGYDALNSFGSPSFYAQAMFGNNRGDVVLPVTVTQPATGIAPTPPLHGGVGVGTWATQAEFKDVSVTNGGRVLYQNDFTHGDTDLVKGSGDWSSADGVLHQSSIATDTRATVGQSSWTDYTYSLQARKISGAEGFLILFHVQNSDNYIWWNIGGWANTKTQLEISRNGSRQSAGPSAPISVETGRWYAIKIEVSGSHIRCYLDGKLVTEAEDVAPQVAPLYSEASWDKATGDVILKVVNVSDQDLSTKIDLAGARSAASRGISEVLAGNPLDVNTIAQPEKVHPVTYHLDGLGQNFTHEFPAYSVSVIRLRAH